ncbi:hypothetical protein AN958_08281 [Leucoagaricus sp. SymC.cos]|nr:hypothetical protein AN958_08281 [Leucoagaricus sp. SymC.cos]
MRSFISSVIFASLAFITLVSALPAKDSNSLSAPKRLVRSTDDKTGIFNGQNDGITGSNDGGSGNNGGDPTYGIGDVLVGLRNKVGPLSQKLFNRLSSETNAEAAGKVCMDSLGEIKDLLVGAHQEISASNLISAHGGGYLTLNGQHLDVHSIADILAKLVFGRTDGLLDIVDEIVETLALIIALLLKPVTGPLEVLVSLLKDVVHIIFKLNLTTLIKVLRLTSHN